MIPSKRLITSNNFAHFKKLVVCELNGIQIKITIAEISRVAGPVLIVLSLVLHVTSVTYCVLKRLRRARAEARARARTEDTDSLETQRSCDLEDPGGRLETECLLTRGTGDIACFPDGSLR